VHPDAKVNGNLKCLLSDELKSAADPKNADGKVESKVLPMSKAEGF
jgi:hypothetical protein